MWRLGSKPCDQADLRLWSAVRFLCELLLSPSDRGGSLRLCRLRGV
jgi:hypothetical protein